jgi:hypothetical protein
MSLGRAAVSASQLLMLDIAHPHDQAEEPPEGGYCSGD